MVTHLTRDEAIDLLVQRDLARLSREEREALLLDWWSIDAGDPDYEGLPDLLKVMIARTDEPGNPKGAIYDPLLKIALKHSYTGVVNSYLKNQIALLGLDDVVKGDVEELATCPCCGYRSLEESAAYDICRVCFWEDDGTTEFDRHSGPNHMTLRDAQQNFQRIGAVTEEVRRYVLSDGRDRYLSEKSVCNALDKQSNLPIANDLAIGAASSIK
ncbi:CPCC family cysteine-rich protein [Undibacterium sp. TJN19]|uniref:CPCC family cysteine-rich protein n=1 Tax=Undibacterium sp. TJN19 TaxID=3413055 RepID=UPI003BF3F1BD